MPFGGIDSPRASCMTCMIPDSRFMSCLFSPTTITFGTTAFGTLAVLPVSSSSSSKPAGIATNLDTNGVPQFPMAWLKGKSTGNHGFLQLWLCKYLRVSCKCFQKDQSIDMLHNCNMWSRDWQLWHQFQSCKLVKLKQYGKVPKKAGFKSAASLHFRPFASYKWFYMVISMGL